MVYASLKGKHSQTLKTLINRTKTKDTQSDCCWTQADACSRAAQLMPLMKRAIDTRISKCCLEQNNSLPPSVYVRWLSQQEKKYPFQQTERQLVA